MSVDILVYLSRSQLPTAEKWSSTVQATGHGVFLPSDFDPVNHTGFLPCKFQGADAGFEYYTGERTLADIEDMELEPDELELLKRYDYSVSLVVKGGGLIDFKTAVIIAACLAKLSGGTTYDPQCGVFSTGEAALADADDIIIEKDEIERNTVTPSTPLPSSRYTQASWLQRVLGRLTGK